MSLRFALIAAAMVIPALPATAQSLRDTHAEVWAPSGKIPQRTFRPLTRNDCLDVQRHHQAGKGQLTPPIKGRRCVTETAMEAPKPAS